MKAKDFKIIRKKLAKLNKEDYDPLLGISSDALSVVPKTLDDEVLTVRLVNSKDVSEQVFQQLFALFEQNMGELYRNSSWGMDPESKAAELRHNQARYVLVETQANHQSLAAFMHYRFEYDDDQQPTEVVLYVYEIQVDHRFQRLGLGKALMAISEQIAVRAEVPKIMLTVFKKNQDAMEFYKRLNYGIDASSPSMHKELADYEILGKSIPR